MPAAVPELQSTTALAPPVWQPPSVESVPPNEASVQPPVYWNRPMQLVLMAAVAVHAAIGVKSETRDTGSARLVEGFQPRNAYQARREGVASWRSPLARIGRSSACSEDSLRSAR